MSDSVPYNQFVTKNNIATIADAVYNDVSEVSGAVVIRGFIFLEV